MFDLFRESLKLGESVARLPWRAARKMVGGRSETVRQAVDLGERLGTLPFRAVDKVMERTGLGAGGARGTPTGPSAGGYDVAPRTGQGGGRPVVPRGKGRIVVVGAGYGGLTCFLDLQDHLPRGYDLVLINADEFHWFTTELHTYVAGEEADSVRIPLRQVVHRPGRLVVGRVERIDPAAQVVVLQGGDAIDYDYLVVALGSDPEYYGLPGVAENSLIVGNYQGAGALRERIASLLREAATPPHIVVAGGGLTGVEVAGELADEYGERLRLTIVEAGPEIMGGFGIPLVQTARQVLQEKGIGISTGNPIARVNPHSIVFKDGSELDCDLLIWAGGVRGSAVMARSGFITTPKGRGKVDQFLRAEGHANVFMVGDSAAFTDPATGRELPPTAQAAVQMGKRAASNLLRRLRGQQEQPFVPQLKGAFASLGRYEGVGQIGEEQYKGLPAMVIKHAIETHHAYETGAGVMPLIRRLLRTPQRLLIGRGVKRHVTPPPAAHPYRERSNLEHQ